jgi:hypothetical protein
MGKTSTDASQRDLARLRSQWGADSGTTADYGDDTSTVDYGYVSIIAGNVAKKLVKNAVENCPYQQDAVDGDDMHEKLFDEKLNGLGAKIEASEKLFDEKFASMDRRLETIEKNTTGLRRSLINIGIGISGVLVALFALQAMWFHYSQSVANDSFQKQIDGINTSIERQIDGINTSVQRQVDENKEANRRFLEDFRDEMRSAIKESRTEKK